MTDKQTSDTVATKAGRIMAMAKQGGPLAVHRPELCEALKSSGNLAPDNVLERLDAILRPYIDDAESIAGSAVSQADGPE